MGRYILCGKEAQVPYEVEELDLRIYTIEELCYYIYHNLSLIDDNFINYRLLDFIGEELDMHELRDKIARFYVSASDLDSTLQMILRDVGYFSDLEIQEFQKALVQRKRKNGPERVFAKAECLFDKGCYQGAVRCYQSLLRGERDGRMTGKFYNEVTERIADCYGYLSQYRHCLELLNEIYQQTKEERLLKKMYDVCVLADFPLPDDIFGSVGDVTLSTWQKDYWSRESIQEHGVAQNPEMDIFLQDSIKVKEFMQEYVEKKKKEYRAMLS